METVLRRLNRGPVGSSLSLVRRQSMAIPLAVSLLVGTIFAATLPPWDLVDEEQHLHYVQHLAERHELPVMGPTYLSPEIVASALATDRWQRLGLRRPASGSPTDMGLEGLSYEAYQPPLFYLVLAVPYSLLPNHILVKLYGLRIIAVLMGTFSVLGSYALVRTIWPSDKILALGAATILALIPERAMAVSRVNNDVLAEMLAVAVLLILARCVMRGLDVKFGAVLGLAMGLALLSKLNTAALIPGLLVVWAATSGRAHLRRWVATGCVVALSAVAISGWFFVRNVALYGDLTGISAMLRIIKFTPKSSIPEVLAALSRGFWAMWWWDWFVYALGFLTILALCAALIGLILSFYRGHLTREEATIILAFAAVTLTAIVGVWSGAVGGWITSVQGRFMLPAYAPAVILGLGGVLRLIPARAHAAVMGTAIAAVLVLDIYVWLHLLPHQYPYP